MLSTALILPVSIRPRPDGQGKPGADSCKMPCVGCFNPPPARWPGETEGYSRSYLSRICFNPPPARWPGETRAARETVHPGMVSIRPRPDGQGKPRRTPDPPSWSRFNPPPARWPGETCLGTPHYGAWEAFQSAPGPMARGNLAGCPLGIFGEGVSIRPRPDGQGKHLPSRVCVRLILFQSAPGPMARGNGSAAFNAQRAEVFQSAPGPMARGNVAPPSSAAVVERFQSAPGPMARGNGAWEAAWMWFRLFQSAPGPMARGNSVSR